MAESAPALEGGRSRVFVSPAAMTWQRQTLRLLLTLAKLQCRRLPLAALAIASLFSNHFVARLYDSRSEMPLSGIESFGAAQMENSLVLVNEMNVTMAERLQRIAKHRGVLGNNWLHTCQGEQSCRRKYFGFLRSAISETPVALVTAVFYEWNDGPEMSITCSESQARVACTYFMYMAMLAAGQTPTRFKDVRFFHYYDTMVESKSLDEAAACSHKSAFDFPLLCQTVAMTCGLVMYFALGSLACIARLKENQFLKMMFWNGLSVSAYWTAVWLMTSTETLVFAGLAAVSYGLQCGEFAIHRLLLAFVGLLVYIRLLAAFTHLCSVIIKRYLWQALLMLLVNCGIICRILQVRTAPQNGGKGRNVSLVLLPFGHIAEFLTEVLSGHDGLRGYHLGILAAMAGMTALALCVTLTLDFLLDAGNGLRLPATFVGSPRFWRPSGSQVDAHPMLQIDETLSQRPNVESVPDTYAPSVRIKDVCKVYSSRSLPCMSAKVVKAVNGVTCAIYEGQITALIGHNGAGKTTLIKMLTGDERPSSGSASIGSCCITDPLERLRMRGAIGVCHQTNVLSSALTVQQSIELTLLSKGLRVKDEMDEAMRLLERLDLHDKRQAKATSLSGGQQRKLCTILALLGRPKVVILDEPTSGLDPVSRRHMWQILQEYKVGRSVILCTQFMDEADILADRKIFLSDGSLICAGSSLFLKHAFACGFVLNVSLKVESAASELMSEMSRVCAGVELRSQFKTELQLQMAPSLSQALPAILRVLEARTDLVEAFGLSQATLDEIFMRLKDVSSQQLADAFEAGAVSKLFDAGAKQADSESLGDFQRLLATQSSKAVAASVPRQFGALMGMNLRRLPRAKLKCCCRFVFPAILLLVLAGALKAPPAVVDILSENFQSTLSRIGRSAENPFSGVCIARQGDPVEISENDCKAIHDAELAVVLKKPDEQTLFSFLQTREVKAKLAKVFWTDGKHLYTPIVYSPSWNRSASHEQLDIAIGKYRPQEMIPFDAFSTIKLVKHFSSVVRHFNGNFKDIYAKHQQDFHGFLRENYRTYALEDFAFLLENYNSMIGVWVAIVLLSIIPVTYISDPIEDKESRVRHQLVSMGMSSLSYWLNTFLLHWVQYGVFVVASAVLFAALLPDAFGNAYFLLGICLPLLLLGTTSNQLTVYVIGTLLETPKPIVTIVYFFFVLFLSMGTPAIQISSTLSLALIWCLPPFGSVSFVFFGWKLAEYGMNFFDTKTLSDVPDVSGMFFSNPLVVQSLVAQVVHVAVLSALLALLEKRALLLSHCRRLVPRRAHQAAGGDASDPGVGQETARLEAARRGGENVLEVRRLEKTYPSGTKAVKGVTFGCVSGEIFGLLGPNGAGKTTTLSVVVGEEAASGGSCEVRHRDAWMAGGAGAALGAIGYCPQHNPLFDSVTVLEHLRFYASIRGVAAANASQQIDNLVRGLGLREHRYKRALQLSGGNKRRLCLAIALLGCPSVVVIDEASTGVDPGAKRFIWTAIRAMVTDSRAVVVTTHSMEEVEALCTRVAIMSRGRIIAFGTIQQLRSRYGHAHTLDILLDVSQAEDADSLKAKKSTLLTSLTERFADCRVTEDLSTRLQLLVPQESVGRLSDALQWLTDSQAQLGVKYFAFYQMSLDQIFARLVKEFEEAEAANELKLPNATSA